MADEIAQWDPGSFKDGVEKKIREVFVDLIPADAFAAMVSKAIDRAAGAVDLTPIPVRSPSGK